MDLQKEEIVKMRYIMKKKVIWNIVALYGLTIAKIIFPLITLPYLTRVLSVGSYGVVSYVKILITYFQILVDFGFLLSGTKDIVKSRDNRRMMESEIGDILFAQIILVFLSFGILIIIVFTFPVVKEYKEYAVLAATPVFLSPFLFDYVFRGLEKMQIITKRFFLMKTISTLLTFIFVKSDGDIIWIPVLEIISSVMAIILILFEINRMEVRIRRTNMRNSINKLRQSAIYFFSNMATTVFSALNTILIGLFLSKEDIAYWNLCIQIISTIQALYAPIIDGVYPSMIKTKEFSQIKKLFLAIMPVVLCGCIFTYMISEYVVLIVAGSKYIFASDILRTLVPVLFFGFPVMLLGWPTLGVIEQQRKVTQSTIISAVFQIVGWLWLASINQCSLVSIAVIRSVTEIVLFSIRAFFVVKNRSYFN